MIVCIDKWYSASKLLLLGSSSSVFFPPVFTKREFRAILLKSVQEQQISSLWCSLGKQQGPEVLEEGGGKMKGGTKAGYILGKLMENFEVSI